MELIERQFANDKEELDDVLDCVKSDQAGCDVVIKTRKDPLGGYWVEVWV